MKSELLMLLKGMGAEAEDVNIIHVKHLIDWLRKNSESGLEINDCFCSFIDFLEEDFLLLCQVKCYFEQVLFETRYRYTFAELGILGNQTFSEAIRNRIFQRLLPSITEDKTLIEHLNYIFYKKNDYKWLEKIQTKNWVRLFNVMNWSKASNLPIWSKIQQETIEAIDLLSLRLAALGVDSEVVRSFSLDPLYISPFLAQYYELQSMLPSFNVDLRSHDRVKQLGAHLDVLLDQCSSLIRQSHTQSKVLGLSVTLSLQLIKTEQSIERIRCLLQLIGALPAECQIVCRIHFFNTLVREANRKYSVADLWNSLAAKIAVRITEHASKTGEKYATESKSEYWGMLKAAMGAGFIIAFMSLIKVSISTLHLPPLWQAVAFSLNYGLGFVLIHVLGFTIATKQPAMTAARIAAAIDTSNGKLKSVDRIVELIVQVSRTQFIAIIGNVSFAFLTASVVTLTWQYLFSSMPISIEKSKVLAMDLHPFFSAAIPHAAIAGICLFIAGVISGYYDNLCLYHRIPDRLRKVAWLKVFLGADRVTRLAEYVGKNFGALIGNFILGCMLGSAGFIGLILGLPIEIRHITFATANLAYSYQSHPELFTLSSFLIAFLGVILIGITNLVVSFSLAFFTALKARGVQSLSSISIANRLRIRFLKTPSQFFFPPKRSLIEQNKNLDKTKGKT